MKPPRLGILGSGKGSNLVAIHHAIQTGELAATIAVVLSDVSQSGIIAHAHRLKLQSQYLNPEMNNPSLSLEAEEAYIKALQKAQVDLVVLAGFMRILKPSLLQTFPNRILNIHPSLLPAFKGKEAWHQALKAGVKETGCTVHLVNASIDSGKILAQKSIPIYPNDTPDTLHQRIQQEEHQLYPKTIAEYWETLSKT